MRQNTITNIMSKEIKKGMRMTLSFCSTQHPTFNSTFQNPDKENPNQIIISENTQQSIK